MPASIASRFKQKLGPDFGQYLAVYVTIVAFSFVTLISVQSLWRTGYWLPYVIGVVIFTVVSDRCARQHQPTKRFIVTCVLAETFLVIVLSMLSDYFFLTTMLSLLIAAT